MSEQLVASAESVHKAKHDSILNKLDAMKQQLSVESENGGLSSEFLDVSWKLLRLNEINFPGGEVMILGNLFSQIVKYTTMRKKFLETPTAEIRTELIRSLDQIVAESLKLNSDVTKNTESESK